MTTRTVPARAGVLALVAALALMACGTASPSATNAPATANGPSPSAAGATATPATGYAGPEATIEYSIWGDPTELKNQQAIVDAFHALEPKITVKVTVSDWDTYWAKLQTG